MIDEQAKKSRKPAVRQRPNSAEQPRPVMSFRIRADLHKQLKDTAELDGLAFSEEIERRLVKSFDDQQRIAELERHIEVMKQTERLLWPDDSARALGHAFGLALSAARHASGQDWREDRCASLIVAGAVRRLMDRCSRDGASIMAEMFDGARVAATADSIANTVGPYLDKAMPPLPETELDVMQWTGRAFLVNEFRDAATGEVLETVTGPEWDAADPEQRPNTGDGYIDAIARLKPIRHKVDVETFTVYVMKDGSNKRISLNITPASPGPQPQAKPTPESIRWAIPDEIAEAKHASNRPSELFDRSDFDKEVAGLPLVKAEREAAQKAEAEKATPTPTRRRKAKAGA